MSHHIGAQDGLECELVWEENALESSVLGLVLWQTFSFILRTYYRKLGFVLGMNYPLQMEWIFRSDDSQINGELIRHLLLRTLVI